MLFRSHGQNAVYYRKTLEDPERRDEVFEKQLADLYSGATLQSATYRNINNLEKPIQIEFEFTGGQFEREGDSSTYVYPYGAAKNLLDAYAKQAYRNQDLKIRVPFANHTTMTYRVEKAQGFDQIPDDVDLESEFGEVHIDYQREGSRLVVDIRYSIDVQRVPVEKYEKFRQFAADMTAALNETIELAPEK